MVKSISSTLSVCPLSLMGYEEETQEQQVEKLIKQLQDQDSDVRSIAAVALRRNRTRCKDAVFFNP